jgi:hypothetical protein
MGQALSDSSSVCTGVGWLYPCTARLTNSSEQLRGKLKLLFVVRVVVVLQLCGGATNKLAASARAGTPGRGCSDPLARLSLSFTLTTNLVVGAEMTRVVVRGEWQIPAICNCASQCGVKGQSTFLRPPDSPVGSEPRVSVLIRSLQPAARRALTFGSRRKPLLAPTLTLRTWSVR